MQIFFKENLAMLAVPKTGSTAYEMALRPRADIIFARRRKHMGLGKFHKRVAPFLAETYRLTPDRLAVMRDPIDQLGSWYRYRTRDALHGTSRSTAHVSFDEFIRAAISDDPPEFADVGSQWKVLTLGDGAMPLHHLFAYEHLGKLKDFLEDRFETDLKPAERNVSPRVPTPLEPATEAALRRARAREFDLHARLMDAGGHLHQKKI